MRKLVDGKLVVYVESVTPEQEKARKARIEKIYKKYKIKASK